MRKKQKVGVRCEIKKYMYERKRRGRYVRLNFFKKEKVIEIPLSLWHIKAVSLL